MIVVKILYGILFILVSGLIIIHLIFKDFEDREYNESVEIYQLPYEEREKVAHLKYPNTNKGIWEYNDKTKRKSS